MFPYNDEENAWVSGQVIEANKPLKGNFILSLLFALSSAVFSTIIPPLIYFLKIDFFQ